MLTNHKADNKNVNKMLGFLSYSYLCNRERDTKTKNSSQIVVGSIPANAVCCVHTRSFVAGEQRRGLRGMCQPHAARRTPDVGAGLRGQLRALPDSAHARAAGAGRGARRLRSSAPQIPPYEPAALAAASRRRTSFARTSFLYLN